MEDIPEVPLIKKQSSNLRCAIPHHVSNLEYICLDPKCATKRLICSECQKNSHQDHEVMHYNVFIQLCNDKTIQLKTLQSSVEEEVKKAEIKHIESLNQIKENFSSFISEIIEKNSCPFFENVKTTANTLINPDIINTAISTLSATMETSFEINEINNQLEIITQNLTYSDEQLGLKLQFGPGIFTSKLLNEVNSMTETINDFYNKSKTEFQENLKQIYTITSINIEEHTKKIDEIEEKTDFKDLKLASEVKFPLEQEIISCCEIIRSSNKTNESLLLALGLESGRVKIFDLLTNTTIKKYFAHESKCIKLLFVEEPCCLYSSGSDQKLSAWKVSENFAFQTSMENNNKSSFVDFCSIFDDKLLAIIVGKSVMLSQYNLIKLTHLDFDEILCQVAYVNSLQTFSRIICGDFKGNVYFIDIIAHGEKMKLASKSSNVHEGYVERIHVITKKDIVVTTGYGDRRLIFHNSSNFQKIKEISLEFMVVKSFYDSLDGIILVEDSQGEEVSVVNLQNDKLERKFNSSKLMKNYIWINSIKTLVCGLQDSNKNFIYLRRFG